MIHLAAVAAVLNHVTARDPSSSLAAPLKALRLSNWKRNHDLGGIVSRSVVVKRQLDDGGIAGVVVGVVVAVGLVAFCLYPVIVGRIRRHRHDTRGSFDAEAGMASGSGDPAGHEAQRRLSSQDSFKPVGDLPRGGLDGRLSKELGWTPHDGLSQPTGDGQAQQDRGVRIDTGVQNSTVFNGQPSYGYRSPSFQAYGEEYMPQEIGDAHNGVLNGTSADYYSPSIPSEAFGMVTTAEEAPADPKRSLSRGSSLRYNMFQLFRRKSSRDQSSNSPSSTSHSLTPTGHTFPQSTDVSLPQIIPSQETTESPVEIFPPPLEMPSPPARSLGSPVHISSTSPPPPTTTEKTPSQSPPPENKFKTSPSPPVNPAPGTVNPMDIMPATTTTEMCYRTEHQLYMSYQKSPSITPMPEGSSPTQTPNAAVSSPSTQTYTHPQPTPVIQSPTPAYQDVALKQEPVEEDDVPMADIPSPSHLSPMPENDARHPSYPSDESTPLPGQASTNASTLNTPATQLDSPSPKSEGLSDYRHSTSPNNGVGNFSPKNGTYPCDEPGCNQVFDQPHKLKHHQRYHTKDHKCTYPGCGKGFGTKTHLQRHINDRHEKKKKFHCAVPGCDYSRQGGKGFPRKDNWKRHMTKIHHMDQQHLPEPVEADQEMGGF